MENFIQDFCSKEGTFAIGERDGIQLWSQGWVGIYSQQADWEGQWMKND